MAALRDRAGSRLHIHSSIYDPVPINKPRQRDIFLLRCAQNSKNMPLLGSVSFLNQTWMKLVEQGIVEGQAER